MTHLHLNKKQEEERKAAEVREGEQQQQQQRFPARTPEPEQTKPPPGIPKVQNV